MTDAASARIGVEARHAVAHKLAAKAKAEARPLREAVALALTNSSALCLDGAEERAAVTGAVVGCIASSPDARFLRIVLGDDPADWMTRAASHGALLQQVCEAAMRLAGVE